MPTQRTTACVRRLETLEDIEALEREPYESLIPSRSVYELFRTTAELCGGRPALTALRSGDPRDVELTLTHEQLFRSITRAANLFASCGIEGSDVVTIISGTYGRIPSLIWGAQTAGIVSCLNHLLSPTVIEALLRAEDTSVLVCPGPHLDRDLWEKLLPTIDRVPTLRSILVIGGGGSADCRFIDFDGAYEAQPSTALIKPRTIDRATPAALFHTGGTTGTPKLVRQTHGNQIHAAWSFAQAFAITENDVGMNGLPMFHVGGTSTWGLSILGAGGHIVLLSPTGYRNPSVVKNAWRIVEHFGVTMTGSVPTTIGAVSEVRSEDCNLRTLRMAQTGGAPLSKAVAERFEKRAGIPLLEQYGMTETVATIASTLFHGKHVRGSVGLRCPFSELRVVTFDGVGTAVDCPPGQVGSVICRGPQVVSGYVNPDHDRGAFTGDGWLITGDLGYLAPDGMLTLTGRAKDLIIRSGHNIDPAAIEEIANAHPHVAASVAVGMPDAYAGEVPVLFVTARADSELDVAELQQFIRDRIPEPPANPKQIFVIDQLPTTAVGKLFKPALRELAIRHKLRAEVAALGAQIDVVDVVLSVGQDKRMLATLTLEAQCSRELLPILESKLLASVTSLTFDTKVIWHGSL